MKIVISAISLVVFIWIGFVVSFQGLNIRKRSSWLYGAVGFLCGLAPGFALTGNLIEGLKIGAIFAFIVLFTGATMWQNKEKYKNRTKSLLRKYGQGDDPSLFAKLVNKLLGKYK